MMSSKIKLLFLRLGMLCLAYMVLRGLFLVFNFQSYQQVSLLGLMRAFSIGLRVDIAAICRTNAVFILLSMLPFAFVSTQAYQRFLKAVFLVSNIPFLILNIAEIEYHKFTGQRSSFELLDVAGDIPAQIGQLSFHYWYLTLLALTVVFSFYYFFPAMPPCPADSRQNGWRRVGDAIALIGVLTLTFIGARGGWQGRPLTPARVSLGDNESLSRLALNSTYTMLAGNHKCDGITKVQYFATDEELKTQFPSKNLSVHEHTNAPDNVVIIIVESLSAAYTGIGNPGHGYTPFLDSLAEKGLYFKNSFADGRRSIDAPPSILAGLSHLRDETFYCAQFKHLHGIGSILKEHGYNTSFFHGGRNGTMHFDSFSLRMGFDSYYGLNEYPTPRDATTSWGIDDEPYLQYVARELSRRPLPFAAVVFTLSTHNPYIMPPGYGGVFPKGDLPIIEIVGYTDHALKKFFETVKNMPWYRNTLFVITGDHIGPQKAISPHMIDNYRVPIVFFHPGRRLPEVSRDKIVRHVDIGPSLLDFLGIATNDTLPFGHSIFDRSYGGLAMGQKDGNFWLADDDYYLEYRQGFPSKLFALAKLDTPLSDKPEVRKRLEKKLKAHIQWFTNGLAQDNLYH